MNLSLLRRARLPGMIACMPRLLLPLFLLVFAVALACWRAQKAFPNEPAGEEAYWRCPMQGGYT